MAFTLRFHANTKPRSPPLDPGNAAIINMERTHMSACAVARKAAVMKTDPGLLFMEFLFQGRATNKLAILLSCEMF